MTQGGFCSREKEGARRVRRRGLCLREHREPVCELMDSGQGLENPGNTGDLCSTSEVRLAAAALSPEIFMSALVSLCCPFPPRCTSRISVPSLLYGCLSMSLGWFSSAFCPLGGVCALPALHVSVHVHCSFVSFLSAPPTALLFSMGKVRREVRHAELGRAPSLALS